MTQTFATNAEPVVLSEEIRDGLLQDLVAVGLILRHLEMHIPGDTRAPLATASAAIDANVNVVRTLIDRLRAA
ncbi:MAG: hypothetical protein WC273_08930 [Dehalococcoidia bacterium]